MKYVLKRSNQVSEGFLQEILKLDAIVYPSELQGDINSLKKRYEKNKEMYLLLYEREKVIGYICFFPITNKMSKDIYTSNRIHDDDITDNDICEYKKDEITDLYLISVVIHPDNRDGEAVKLLTDGFIKFINEKIDTGFKIGKIIGTAVSNDGKKFMNRLNFKEIKKIEHDYIIMDCEAKDVKVVNLKKDYKDDIYIMIPFTGELNVKQKSNIQENAVKYLKIIREHSEYECNNSISKKLQRIFLGRQQLAYMNDEYDGNILDKIDVDLFVTTHKETNLHVLTITILNNKFLTTQIQDQVSSNHLYICENGNLINIEEYMQNIYGLKKCGDAKCIICLSNKPKDEKELYCMLAGEVYNGLYNAKYDDNYIESKEIIKMATENISQYNFYEAYSSESSIIYVMNKFSEDIEQKLEYEALLLFIVELIIFQNSSIKRTNMQITEGLSKEGNVSLKCIENLYKEFGKTIVFWDYNNFNYSTSQNLANKINERFKTNEALETYYRNQNFLEHIVDLRNVQESNKENKILNCIVIILTVLQVLPTIISFFQWVLNKNINLNAMYLGGTTGSIALLIILLIMLKRRNKKKKQRL